jgi:lipase chaperone LimK
MSKKKKIFIFAGIAVFLIFLVFLLLNHLNIKSQENYLEKHYIFDKTFRTDKKITDYSDDKYFSNGVVTAQALDLFKLLEQKFAVKSLHELSEHFNEVKKYLYTRFNEAEAQKLDEIYHKYLECIIKLENNQKYRVKTTDPKRILILLNTIQNFRRDSMGKENADALFGNDVKEREYLLRRAIIIGDKNLYGKEKENRLQELKGDMWSSAKISIGEDSSPYNRYQLKMQLYQKDLAELDESERKFKIEEFRKEFFSKEQIKKLREVDDQIAKEKANIKRYRAAEKDILNLKNMTQEEKDKKIRALQNEFFGGEADAFRRREALRKGGV